MSLLQSSSAKYTVPILSIVAFLIPLAIMVGKVLEHTHGVFAYPLDDSYIHLAVAKNLTVNSVWGISGHEFASASSSILYPLLLSGIFKITGVVTIIPFLVNLAVAIVFLLVVQRWLVRQGIAPAGQLIVLLLAIFLIPLPGIVMVGMEHTLHLLFFFLFLTSFSDVLEKMVAAPGQPVKMTWPVYVYGVLMMAARFESMALLGFACVLLVFHRRWIAALQLGFVCFLPVLIFGIVSISKGGFFLPNAVMLKPSLPSGGLDEMIYYIREEYFPRFFSGSERYNTLGVQRLLLLIPLTYFLFRKATREKMGYQYMLLLLFAATIFHLAFAAYSFYARYEVYLVGSFVVVASTLFVKYFRVEAADRNGAPEWVGWLLGVFLLAPLVTRSWNVFDQVALGSIWTYDQQCQMGKFVQQYYDWDGVVFNDIGGVSYFSEGKKLDILGLGNNDVAQQRRQRMNTPDLIDSLGKAKDAKIAIVYEPRFKNYTRNWRKVASWDIPYDDPIGFYDSVTFYAVNPGDAPMLMNNLKKYQPSLPKEIVVRYY